MTFNRGFLFAVLVVVAAVGNASAATHIVGDTLGWTVPPTPAAYSAWASRQVFRVGDVLVFNYNTGFHDVAHVTKAAYDGCSSNNPIALATVGPSNFTLGSAGQDYYICTFGTHCAIGQKLAINVTAATTPTPTMPPSTTPVTPTPTMPPSTTPVTPTPTMPPTTTPPTPTPTMPPTTTPTPTMPPSTTPTPTMPPTMTPMSPPPSGAPSMSPSGAMTPGSPMPNGGAPPPTPSSESTPDGSSPPQAPPSSATIASVCTPLIVFASVLFALVI